MPGLITTAVLKPTNRSESQGILALGIKGYYRLYEYLPAWVRVLAKPFLHIFQWLGSFAAHAHLHPSYFPASEPDHESYNQKNHFRQPSADDLRLTADVGPPCAAGSSPVAETLPKPAFAQTDQVLPSWPVTYTFEQLGRPGDSLLLGINSADQVEFGMRRDRIASDASLQLEYTPSPSLIPTVPISGYTSTMC